MANTLTDLFPDLYAALDVVSRELTGFIPAVNRDARTERAAVDQTVRVPVTTDESARDISPGPTVPDDGDTTVNNRTITISKSRAVPVRFQGEEERGLETAGTFDNIRQQRFAQAMRTLTNEIETDLAGTIVGASRAYGTAGTAPFGTKDDFSDFAGVAEILDENGAPSSNRQLVAGSGAWFNLRGTQTGVLQRANEAGSPEALREGEFGSVHGMILRNSGQVQTQAAATDYGWVINGTPSIGDTSIPVDGGTASDEVQEGDEITFAGDDRGYIVAADFTGASGNITINEPGLKAAPADGAAVTVENTNAGELNAAFHRNAIQLAARLPALPDGGDAADDRTTIQDPMTGLAFDIAIYRGYHQIHYEVGMAWGQAMTKEEHSAILWG